MLVASDPTILGRKDFLLCVCAAPQNTTPGKEGDDVINDISILVLKTWKLKPGSQGKPYVDQSGQGTAQMLVGSSPGPPEIGDPRQGEQKPANLPSVNTGGLKSTLETLELNPDPPKTT
ncbi:hypothetical protein DSO57_1011516 [Entomophthora muscae]|uniref:Uncharacterized protein n=1 Tax=Entomophthora muscae TaxID=34485 RepID=A0ACC2SJ13_9FUNG|nr:hypothetical protein DSO57_1011516 [Entomophthora muscae]